MDITPGRFPSTAANRLVVEFRGGGACWDALTCSFAVSTFQETVGNDPWVLDETQARGIYDHRNPDNPFKDWHHVYIPCCTGDIHWGDNVMTYAGQAYPTWIPGVSGEAVQKLPALYDAIGGHYPDMKLAQYNTVYDEDPIFFFKAMGGGEAADWSSQMRASVDEIAGSTPNFRYYLAPGEEHCAIPYEKFYTAESNGVRLVDWIRERVEGKAVESIDCEDPACAAPSSP